jgi:hypothetical protein
LQILIDRGHILDEEGTLSVSDTGREIAKTLGGNLPLTIRERALQTAVRMTARAKNAKQTKAHDHCRFAQLQFQLIQLLILLLLGAIMGMVAFNW